MGHATVRLDGQFSRVAVDPWRWRDDTEPVDLVLVTHGHADHCSEDDLVAASHERTTVLAPESLARRLRSLFGERLRVVREGDDLTFAGVRVRVLPAEGPTRALGFHPRGHGVSYLVTLEEMTYLFLGDSVALAEHSGLAPDVAFVAVGGLTVMDPAEAADAAAAIRPGLAVPIHWGDLNGRFDLAARFATLCAQRDVRAAAKPAKEFDDAR
jgi:L-ascorbate metabolism protein UlaG (beta-lactamase superfamily)